MLSVPSWIQYHLLLFYLSHQLDMLKAVYIKTLVYHHVHLYQAMHCLWALCKLSCAAILVNTAQLLFYLHVF